MTQSYENTEKKKFDRVKVNCVFHPRITINARSQGYHIAAVCIVQCKHYTSYKQMGRLVQTV